MTIFLPPTGCYLIGPSSKILSNYFIFVNQVNPISIVYRCMHAFVGGGYCCIMVSEPVSAQPPTYHVLEFTIANSSVFTGGVLRAPSHLLWNFGLLILRQSCKADRFFWFMTCQEGSIPQHFFSPSDSYIISPFLSLSMDLIILNHLSCKCPFQIDSHYHKNLSNKG